MSFTISLITYLLYTATFSVDKKRKILDPGHRLIETPLKSLLKCNPHTLKNFWNPACYLYFYGKSRRKDKLWKSDQSR